MDSVVQRLHRALAEALQRRRPDIEAAPVSVAEIYQELVPYRAVRGSVGFEMNADYEHALLCLLAGEEALVRLEPEEVRQQLEQELATPNPDVTLFRRFAACDVWVSAPVPADGAGSAPGAPPEALAAEAPPEAMAFAVGEEEDWTPAWLEAAAREVIDQPAARRPWMAPDPEEPAAGDAARGDGEVGDPPAPPRAPGPEAEAPRRAGAAPERAVAEPQDPGMEREVPRADVGRGSGMQCPFCHGALPLERQVRYCPYCGVDQQLRPCPRCGEYLEPGWRYCVGCGAPAPTGTA